ncbi:Kelch repeat-containing protein [Neptunitalea lumnitzerae]|uniref:Galactose oxidase n=1 Tax=Neptunitalea lumnitzerae TaxID=2965509 RepID=A0ABQ5MM05_9FLAO|nr:hypothetical protein [Neptunitalea sp. Y10]GLB50451.1 hypothetical protein Y10_28190 [Neptunitalea sp. Y10]
MKIKYLSILFLLCFVQIGIAQTIGVTIYNKKNNEPVSNVSVSTSNATIIGQTNRKGFVVLSMEDIKSSSMIIFDHSDFERLEIESGKMKDAQSIFLIEKPTKLEEVTLFGDRKLQSKLKYTKLSGLDKRIYGFGLALVGDKIYVQGGDLSNSTNTFLKGDLLSNNLGRGTSFLDVIMYEQRRSSNYEGINDEMYVYDIKKDTWTEVDKVFKKRAYHEMIPYQNRLYLVGGKFMSRNKRFQYLENEMEIYDLEKDTVYVDRSYQHDAINFTAVNYKGNFLFLGGEIKKSKKGEPEYTAKAHLFDAAHGFWYPVKDMPKEQAVKGVLVENKIYFVGGIKNTASKIIKSYNLSSGEWKNEGELFTTMELPALCAHDHLIYIYENGIFYTFNTLSKELNRYHINLQYYGSRIVYYENALYLIGGIFTNRGVENPSSNMYKIDLDEFVKTRIVDTVSF